MSTPSTRRLTALLIFVLLFSPACGIVGGGSPTGELTLDQEITFGPGSFLYTDTRAGLSALASYTVSLTLEFDGSRDGQPEQWRRTYLMLASNEPRARQWTIETTGAAAQTGPVFLAALGELDYEIGGEQGCTASIRPAGESFAERLELATFLPGVAGAQAGGTDRVNEIAADRYTFDERALGDPGRSESTGEMWIASEGGYIVRYLLTTTGTEEYFGQGLQGTLFTAYELTAPNQPVAIDLPEDCPPGMVDAPLPPDASEVVESPGALTFRTSTSPEDVAAFYAQQLPGLGWAADGDPMLAQGITIGNYNRGLESLAIITRLEEDGRTTVNLVLGTTTPD